MDNADYMTMIRLIVFFAIAILNLDFARRQRGAIRPTILSACGGLSNFLCMATNGKRMPVDAAVFTSSRSVVDEVHVVANSGTHLTWLMDRFFLWSVPSAGIFSIGDVAITAGIIGLLAQVVLNSLRRERRNHGIPAKAVE
jgi:Family of unknown function (DUF5317)